GERSNDRRFSAADRMGDMAAGEHANERNHKHESKRQPQNRPAKQPDRLAHGVAFARGGRPRRRFPPAARSSGGFTFHLSHEASSSIHRTNARKLMSL